MNSFPSQNYSMSGMYPFMSPPAFQPVHNSSKLQELIMKGEINEIKNYFEQHRNLDSKVLNECLLFSVKNCKISNFAGEFVEELLNRQVDINTTDNEGKTALMYAAEKGYLELVDQLLTNKANAQILDKYRKNALYYSIDNKNSGENIDVICKLCQHKSDINIITNENMTPLMKAVEKGYESIVEFLLKNKADIGFVRNSTNDNLFHVAIRTNNLKIIELLINNNVNINKKNNENLTPLELAKNIDQNLFERVNELIKKKPKNEAPLINENLVIKSEIKVNKFNISEKNETYEPYDSESVKETHNSKMFNKILSEENMKDFSKNNSIQSKNNNPQNRSSIQNKQLNYSNSNEQYNQKSKNTKEGKYPPVSGKNNEVINIIETNSLIHVLGVNNPQNIIQNNENLSNNNNLNKPPINKNLNNFNNQSGNKGKQPTPITKEKPLNNNKSNVVFNYDLNIDKNVNQLRKIADVTENILKNLNFYYKDELIYRYERKLKESQDENAELIKKLNSKEEEIKQKEDDLKKKEEDLNQKNEEIKKIKKELTDQTTKLLEKKNCVCDFDEYFSFPSPEKYLSFKEKNQILISSGVEVEKCLDFEISIFQKEVEKFHNDNYKLFTELIDYVKDAIIGAFPNSVIETYGSFATGLCLPYSDIDLVVDLGIKSQPGYPPNYSSILLKIEDALKKLNFVQETKTIPLATVPVVKITCKEKYLNKRLDITIKDTKHNGLSCVDLVKKYLANYPSLKPLVLVLKYMIYSLDLYDTYQGGLSSYGLILMIVTFLQYFKTNQYSLGSLLLKFFYCFGWDFDYKFQQIIPLDENLKEPETINPVQSDPQGFYIEKLIILDPTNRNNNVGRCTHKIGLIKKAFYFAYVVAHLRVCINNQKALFSKDSDEICCILKKIFNLPSGYLKQFI